MNKREKTYKNGRLRFLLMLEKELYDEVKKRARERFQPMTGYIIKAVIDRILSEKKYE